MAGWQQAGEDRWTYVQDDGDGSRNYLARRGERLIEMHVSGAEATFHGYVVAPSVELDPANPLMRATWRRSRERQLPAAVSGGQAWQLITEAEADLFGDTAGA